MPFQKDGIKFAIEKNGRCLIADEMGLGKTIQAISVAYCYREEWPLLIIVPASLKFCWIEEIEKWLPDVLPHQINLVHCGTDANGIDNSPITLVTYGLLRMPTSRLVREAIEARQFKVIICDESHYLKNHKSLSTKTVIPLIKKANRRILLSGTPALSRPVELYPQIDAICPNQFGTFWKYTERYCDAHTVFFGKFKKRECNGASNLLELQQKLTSLLMIRREKSEVLTELPPKQRQRVLFELKDSPMKKEILKSFAELRQTIVQGKGGILHPDQYLDTESRADQSVHYQISKLYKLSGDAKIGPVREYIEMLCENEELKFLVFAYHHDMMDGIQQTLWEKKVKFVRIDGKTNSADRQVYVKQFQSDKDTRVAVLSILAAGVGLTFTAANLVVFAELYWTPGVMVQCEDRAHRIGQTSNLSVHYLVARGTMDEWVWSAVCKKTIVTSTALTGHTRQLDHEEGEGYQVALLSNADMWEPEKVKADVNVSDLVQNQRPANQSSILEFFSSQQTSTPKSAIRKRKFSTEQDKSHRSFLGINSEKPSSSHCTGSKDTLSLEGSNALKSKSTKKMKLSDIVVVSDDDDETAFKCDNKKSKATTKKKKKPKPDTISSQKLLGSKKVVRDKEKSSLKLDTSISIILSDEESNPLPSAVCGPNVSGTKFFGQGIPNSDRPKESENLTVNEAIDEQDNVMNSTSFVKSKDSHPDEAASEKLSTISPGVSNAGTVHDEPDFNITDDTFFESPTKMGDNSNIETNLNSPMEECDVKVDAFTNETVASSKDQDAKTPVKHPMVSVLESHDQTDANHWSCKACTYLNHLDLPHCEICDTPKSKNRVCKNQRNNARTKVKREINSSGSTKKQTMSKEILHSKVDESLEIEKKSKMSSGQDQLDPLHQESELEVNSSPFTRINGSSDSPLSRNKRHKPIKHEASCSSEESILKTLSPDSMQMSSSLDNSKSSEQLETKFNNSIESNSNTNKSSEQLEMDVNNSDKEPTAKTLPGFMNIEPTENNSVCESSNQLAAKADNSISTDGENAGEGQIIPVHQVFKYSCSLYTGRIYVYDESGMSLDANFHPMDIEVGNFDDLPELLQLPQHQKLIKKFTREWSSLSETKRKLIAKSGLYFTSPLAVYEAVKTTTGSKQRHFTKEDNIMTAIKRAENIKGSVRMIAKHSEIPTNINNSEDLKMKGIVQTVTEEGVPVCLQCQKPYSNPLLSAETISKPENAWQLRLCSHACMDKYWTITKGSYCRDKIYEIEHGVCKLCNFDAQALFTQVKFVKDLTTRADLVNKSPYQTLTCKQKQKMIETPMAGQFWHVDHIVPVWQGGGMCDLDNLRTLCTLCHLKVTRRQATQRASMKKLSLSFSNGDITAFFQKQ
ncbi:DNA annealing helicase and endonuclease ZRANB3-like [Physella acuta]|uniref:DNA annealing helicase and endonuclease ZRANB3-like n=1 Tax=Physella acuta TaxID=109671 RepID=UPI0027DCD1E2|nr:DNA annealing helicase and endonuclease ZRANB3-like [Physella acuta]